MGAEHPDAGAGSRPWDRVVLRGVRAQGFHGVFDHERRDGQLFSVDLIAYLDTRSAADSDDLVDTVDYGALADLIGELIRGEPVSLIETLAHRIAVTCLERGPCHLTAVDVTVHKPHAPISEAVIDASVTVRRDRGDLPEEKPV
jgi:dihydroneopterin aldolase/2-amino-4-hydroxy-6-hydroxymethyldihydropteridine diphosphokinase